MTLSSDGRYAYVTDGIAGLEIIDVQDPTNPTRAGGFDTNGEAYQVTLCLYESQESVFETLGKQPHVINYVFLNLVVSSESLWVPK